MRKIFFYNLILAVASACFILYWFAAGEIQGQSGESYIAASSKQASEYEIKAVYLYNFLLFAIWPDDDGNDNEVGEICIGIVGSDPFGDSFSEIEGKVIKSLNKKLVIKRYGPYGEADDLGSCRLLFVCASEKGNISKIIRELKGKRTLTVADAEGFLKSGGMIKLVKVKKKIRWEINRTPLKKANIRLSSQLLRNAVKIVEIPEVSENERVKDIAGRTR